MERHLGETLLAEDHGIPLASDVRALRTVHVAAVAFPSTLGTNVAVRAMVRTACDAGYVTTLACHPERSSTVVRSGPSLRKMVENFRMAWLLATRRPRPDCIVAHHVEGAYASIGVPCPRLFVAHTSVETELDAYVPVVVRGQVSRYLGRIADAGALRSSVAWTAVAPALARRLSRTHRVTCDYLPVPWGVCPTLDRALARESLRLHPTNPYIGYLGNLDAYQGWEDVIGALVLLPTEVGLVVASESSFDPLIEAARTAGVADRVRMVSLDDVARERVSGAIDVAIVPRKMEGGVPVKLLDALSRGIPTIVTERAACELPLGQGAMVVANDSAAALANGVKAIVAVPALAESLSHRGRDYIAHNHSSAAFLHAYERAIENAFVQFLLEAEVDGVRKTRERR